ncbi:hypothetical protein J1614_001675 [Plenodomus biglobosus]|nr:hypothetical protein J1614_001675 [Plenodomus biglobosus]
MRLSGLSFLPSLLCIAYCAKIDAPLDCEGSNGNTEACAQSVDDVVAIVPGVSYVASIACDDCPYVRPTWTIDHETLRTDQILLLNVTLAADNRTILLNDEPIYPLPTIPIPPDFWVTQRPADFSNTNLSSGIHCANPYCQGHDIDSDCKAWCTELYLSSVKIDYLYTVDSSQGEDADKDAKSQYWEVTIDIIGGKAGTWFPHWRFDNASQKSLWFLVEGKESQRGKARGSKDRADASDLFGAGGKEDSMYKYQIIDLRLKPRTYTFASKKPLGVWRTIGRFLGADVWQEEGKRFLYLGEDWGEYGKKGTLRNSIGHFLHWDGWSLFWYILASTIAAIFVVVGSYKLYFWVQQQKQLMSWDGMDDVWDRLRHEPQTDEGATLLPDAYQDEPDVGGSSGPFIYTDEPLSMKPLPSKPLPEKPLPAVPLIDA